MFPDCNCALPTTVHDFVHLRLAPTCWCLRKIIVETHIGFIHGRFSTSSLALLSGIPVWTRSESRKQSTLLMLITSKQVLVSLLVLWRVSFFVKLLFGKWNYYFSCYFNKRGMAGPQTQTEHNTKPHTALVKTNPVDTLSKSCFQELYNFAPWFKMLLFSSKHIQGSIHKIRRLWRGGYVRPNKLDHSTIEARRIVVRCVPWL